MIRAPRLPEPRSTPICPGGSGNCPRGKRKLKERPMTTVWIYVDTRYRVGDPGHLKVFADEEAANRWLEENDPEGVAFEYGLLE